MLTGQISCVPYKYVSFAQYEWEEERHANSEYPLEDIPQVSKYVVCLSVVAASCCGSTLPEGAGQK